MEEGWWQEYSQNQKSDILQACARSTNWSPFYSLLFWTFHTQQWLRLLNYLGVRQHALLLEVLVHGYYLVPILWVYVNLNVFWLLHQYKTCTFVELGFVILTLALLRPHICIVIQYSL